MRIASLLTLVALLVAAPAQAQTDYMVVADEAALLDGGTLGALNIGCFDRAPDGSFVFYNTSEDNLVSYSETGGTTVLRTEAQIDADTDANIFACRAIDIAPDGTIYAALGGNLDTTSTSQRDLVYRLAGASATVLTDSLSVTDDGDGITGLAVSGSTIYLARTAFFGAPEDGFYSINTTTANQTPTVVLQDAGLDLYDIAVGSDGSLYSNSSEFGSSTAGFQNVVVKVSDPGGSPSLSVVYDPYADGIFTNGSDGGLEDIELGTGTGPDRLYLFNNSFGDATTGEQWGFALADGTAGEQFANESGLIAATDSTISEYSAPSGTHTVYADGTIYEAVSSSFGGTTAIVKYTNIPPAASFSLTASAPGTVAAGTTLPVTLTATNNSGASATVQAVLVARRNGNVVRTITLGSGTLPDGATVTRTVPVRVPATAPAGTYDITIELRVAGNTVASDDFQVTITEPARLASGPVEYFTATPVDFSAAATTATTAAVRATPNPFAGTTRIAFATDATADVRLAVYDVLGREVAVLVDGALDAGQHVATFDARGLAAGTYVYRLSVGSDVQTGRVTLTR